MAKTIECELYRSILCPWTILSVKDDKEGLGILDNWKIFKQVAPALSKGLRPGQSRNLTLTQTKRGIKLEVKK